MNISQKQPNLIRTPEYRLRVFVSSTLKELAAEREAVRQAILQLRLIPVMFEAGARPHPAQSLYQAYLCQSHIFIGIYWQSYGWIAPDKQISGLEDEYNLSSKLPRLIYIKNPEHDREVALTDLLTRIRDENTACYKPFSTPAELRELVEGDLALLLSESFEVSQCQEGFEEPKIQPLTNVPIPRNPLIGREQELKTLCNLLMRDEIGLVTLTGPGGSGKSRLGIQVALELRDRFTDGVYMVGLEAINDPELVIPAIAKTLGVTNASIGSSLTEALNDFLRNKRLLLLLDNFEQVLAASPKIVELLETCPHMKVLATSRAPLQVRAENEFPVPLLALPPLNKTPDPIPLSQYSAVQLFIQRAKAVKPDFMITDQNALAVAEICHRLDGLPLAIELAAARIRMLSPHAMLGRLEHRLEMLRGGVRDFPQRHQTLYSAIEWSYNLLAENEKLLLRRLSVFAGGWTFDSASAICNADEEAPVEVFDGLERLIGNNLVKPPEEVNGELRLKTLETIREFSHQHFIESGEADTIHNRYMQYFLSLAEEAEIGLHQSSQGVWHKRLETELDNFRMAMGLALEQNQPAIALRIASALLVFWESHGFWREALQWLERGLTSMGSIPIAVRAKAILSKGQLSTFPGEYPRAIALIQESLSLWRQIDDKVGIAKALNPLAMLFMFKGDFTGGKAMLEESLSLWHQVDDPSSAYLTIKTLGNAAINLELYDQAKEYYIEASEGARKMGDEAMVSVTLIDLGEVYTFQGDYQLAEECYSEADIILQKLGDRIRLAEIASGRALVAIKQGDYDRAHDLLVKSIPVLHEGSRKGAALLSTERLAFVAAGQNHPEHAVRLLSASDSQRKALGFTIWPIDREDHECLLSTLRSKMGDAIFAAVWVEGSKMTMEELIAYSVDIEGHA